MNKKDYKARQKKTENEKKSNVLFIYICIYCFEIYRKFELIIVFHHNRSRNRNLLNPVLHSVDWLQPN